MHRQLKQTALPYSLLSCEHFRKHYGSPDAQRPLPDIERRVDVRAGLMAARNTLEGGLVGAVPLVDTATRAAFTRRVARIDKTNRNAGALCLVSDKAAELGERPITKPCALVASGRYPSTDAFEIFKGNAASGAFSILHEHLRYAVVGVGLEPPLFAGQFLQPTLGSLRAALLQSTAPLGVTLADPFDISTGVNCSVAVGGEVDDAKIDAKPILGVELVGLGDVAGCSQHPLSADEAKINLALAVAHQASLVLAHHDRHDDAAFQRPQADRAAVLYEADNAIVVGLGGVGTEHRSDFTVDLECVGHLGDAADSSLCSQSEVGADGVIRQFVEIELPERAAVEAYASQPRARLVAARQRARQDPLLFRRRQHLQGGNQLHALKYRRFPMQCQVLRADARTAIPLSPEGDSLSRRT